MHINKRRHRPKSGHSLGKIFCCLCVCEHSISGFDCIIFLYGTMPELADVSENGNLHCNSVLLRFLSISDCYL